MKFMNSLSQIIRKIFPDFIFIVFLNLLVAGCAATLALDDNFKPKPIPKIDYSAFQSEAKPEMVVNLGNTIYQGFAFSPDGRLIATADFGNIQLWNSDGKLLKNFHVPNSTINIGFSLDGQRIVSAGLGGLSLTRIDGSPVWEKREKGTQTVSYSPDGGLIASAGWDKTVKLWRTDGSLLMTLVGHMSRVRSVAISPDGGIIASGSDDKTIKLWNSNGQLLKTLRGHSDAIQMVVFRPDGKILASCSEDNTVKLWSITGRLLKTLKGHTRGVNCIAFSPGGEILASGGLGGIFLWNSAGKLIRKTDDSASWIAR
jgi:WD40 repeat protein